eukprot:353522-Chlamydomonas_euryale.AAC.10
MAFDRYSYLTWNACDPWACNHIVHPRGSDEACLGHLAVQCPFACPCAWVLPVHISLNEKVNMPSVDITKFSDSYFKAAESKRVKKGEKEFFDEPKEKKALPAEYIANQKALDAAILPALSAELKGYLSSRFTLRDGDRPHLMKF